MPAKPPASLLLEWMTASAALTPTTEPVAIGVLWRDDGVLTYSAGIPPAITSQPSDTTVVFSSTASFAVTATNAVSYQWQVSSDGGAIWTAISGATASSYSFTAQSPDTLKRYRVIVTGPGGTTTSNAAILTVQSMVGSLSLSSTSVTDGDSVTFSSTLQGATTYQLWRGTNYIWGGDSLPLTKAVGVLDAGSYTLVGTNQYGTYTTSAVVLTVAASDLVNDDFSSGSPSANWSSTSGAVIAGSKLSLNGTSLGSGLSYVQRTITNANMRVRFTVETGSMTSGQVAVCAIQGTAQAILNINIIYSGSGNIMRVAPNVGGFFYGAANRYNYDTAQQYSQTTVTASDTVEIRWDFSTKSAWIYINDILFTAVKQATTGAFAPQQATYVRFGKTASTAFGGTVLLSNIKVKEGTPAARTYGAKSRMAHVINFGQSNAHGAASNSYNSTTDAVPGMLYIRSATDAALDGSLVAAALTSSDSTNATFGFLQGVKLPDGFSACIQNGGVGSTGFTTNPGWTDDGTGLYRTRLLNVIADFGPIPEESVPFAMTFQGFESDVALSDSTYRANINGLVSAIRTALGSSTVPLVIGGFSPAYLTGGENANANTIRTSTSNEAIVAADSNAVFASSVLPSALGYQAGTPFWIHFTAAGYRALGARYATAFTAKYPRAAP